MTDKSIHPVRYPRTTDRLSIPLIIVFVVRAVMCVCCLPVCGPIRNTEHSTSPRATHTTYDISVVYSKQYILFRLFAVFYRKQNIANARNYLNVLLVVDSSCFAVRARKHSSYSMAAWRVHQRVNQGYMVSIKWGNGWSRVKRRLQR